MRKVVIGAALLVVVTVAAVWIGRQVTFPDAARGMSPDGGSWNVAVQELVGTDEPTDFLIDYASARALRAGDDPYEVTATILDEIDAPPWAVSTANPHPPTTLPLVLPYTFLRYDLAVAAWAWSMVGALVLTTRLIGVRWTLAVPVGCAVAVLWPGAYGIGNVVPLIGLGVAIAYRFRDDPVVAALGLTLAAAPKSSGLLLVIPFAITWRWRVVWWTAASMAVLALVPLLLHPRTWHRYLDAGADAIRANAGRQDNAAILNGLDKAGIPTSVTFVVLAAVAILVAWRVRDALWPTVWFMVAALPISWMYSLLTLLPLAVRSIRLRRPAATAASIAAAGLAAACPPSGLWPTWISPLVVALMLVPTATAGGGGFWTSWPELRDRVRTTRDRTASDGRRAGATA